MVLHEQKIKEIQAGQQADTMFLPRLFNALGDPTRWRIFTLLLDYDDLCVTDLANILNISVPAASQQLRILELSGVISKERMGQAMCYHVQANNPATKMIVRLAKAIKK